LVRIVKRVRSLFPNIQEVDDAFTEVRKKDAEYIITQEMKDAFDLEKNLVANMQAVSFPSAKKTLYLDTDASQVGTGGFLHHEITDTCLGRRLLAYCT